MDEAFARAIIAAVFVIFLTVILMVVIGRK